MSRRSRALSSRYKGRTPEVPEKRVMREIRAAAEALGFQVLDMTQPRASMMPVGMPDYLMRHKAKRFICWVEVKAEGGKPRPEQIGWMEFHKACGGVAFVADSVEAFVNGLHANGFPVEPASVRPHEGAS